MRTQPIPTLAASGLLAMMALPGTAVADPAPLAGNGIPVDPNQSVSGHFDAAGTQNWRVYMQQGRYYALRGVTGGYEDVVVRTPGGAVASRFSMAFGDDNGDGASFRATVAGLYSVAVTLPTSCFYGTPCLGGDRTGDYLLSVGRDCPGNASTPCYIGVGTTLHHLWASFGGDSDWFRVSLSPGTAYELSVPVWPTGGDLFANVVDARGRLVAGTASGSSRQPLRFTVPATGAYYVAAFPDAAVGQYDLSLQRAP